MEDLTVESFNVLNNFFILFFQYMKYIFAFILLILGILTLLSLRKLYFDKKLVNTNVNEDFLRKSRLIVGSVYIIMGSGILFNYLTYFLILILDPLPDQLISNFIINLINSIFENQYYIEEYIFEMIIIIVNDIFAFGSFFALLWLFLSFWYFFHNNILKNPRKTLIWLTSSVASGIVFGFSTCLPFLL